jgi:pimeloyl-ACP methyl ester carboxylesterase
VELPALLLSPKQSVATGPLIVHVAENGKPIAADAPNLALSLCRLGFTVLAVDVRGAGETDPRKEESLLPVTQYDPVQWRVDSTAVCLAYAGTTALALQALDVIRFVDHVVSSKDLAAQPLVLVGEGLGGLWCLVAAAFDSRPAAVCCVGMVPSYKLIVGSRDYAVRDYFWVPGALVDYDISDLPGLVAPRPVVLLDSVTAKLEPLEVRACAELCAWAAAAFRVMGRPAAFQVLRATGEGVPADLQAHALREVLGQVLAPRAE